MKYETLLPDATLLWNCPASKAPTGGLVIAGSTVAVLGTHLIEARELATGEIRWSTPSRTHELFPISDTRIGGRGRKAKAGYWEGLDAETGESMWTQIFEGWPPERPQVCGNEAWRLVHREERALTSLHGISAEDGTKLESVIAPFAQTAGVSVEYFWTARHEASPIGRGLMRYDRANREWETLSRDPHSFCEVDELGAVLQEHSSPEINAIAVFDYAGGDSVWRYEVEGPVSAAADREVVHVMKGTELIELNRGTGEERWKAAFPEEHEFCAAPQLVGKRVLVPFRNAPAKVLDAANGKETGSLETTPTVSVAKGHALIVSEGELAVYRL